MLPIWAACYALLVLGLQAWDAVATRRRGKHILPILVESVCTVLVVVIFSGYFHPPLIEPLGRATLPVFVFAYGYLVAHASIQILREPPQPNLSPRQDLVFGHIAVAMTALFMAPAAGFGMLAALRAW